MFVQTKQQKYKNDNCIAGSYSFIHYKTQVNLLHIKNRIEAILINWFILVTEFIGGKTTEVKRKHGVKIINQTCQYFKNR